MKRALASYPILNRSVKTGVFVALFLLAPACGGTQPSITFPTYQYSCCPAQDVNQVWRPGATVELHWIVQQGTPAADTTPHPITLIATIKGPYTDVATLKKGAGATIIVQGSIIKTNDRRSGPAPVSTFILPPDLAPGYYNLEFKDDFGGGNSMGGASIIQVGPAS